MSRDEQHILHVLHRIKEVLELVKEEKKNLPQTPLGKEIESIEKGLTQLEKFLNVPIITQKEVESRNEINSTS